LEANPVWSPDGQWIAFGRNTDGNSDIWIMRPDGSEQRAVTAGDAFDSNPSWSPSGKQIVFASERGGDRDVYMLDVETAAVTQFTTDPFYDGSPAWSPFPPRGENPIDAVESWVAYDDAGELDQLAQFDLAVIDAQPGRNYTAEEIEELRSNGTIVLSTLNVGACESFRPYFAMCEAKLEEAVPDVAGEYYIDITHPDMQAALLAYADELWHTGVSGFYLTNVDVGWTRERPELTDSVIAFVSALRDRYPDRIIVLESREPDLFRLFDAAGRPVHWLVDGESFPVLSRGWRHDFAPMFDEDRALLAQRLEILQAQRLTIFTLDWAADDGSACAAYGFSVDQGFLGYVATNGELSEVATWSCLGP
jgi:endo-alpha-1,4-polygalactosaminidase (GH114 family)